MYRKFFLAPVAAAMLVASFAASAQAQFGTAAEAKALLEKAVAALKANEADALAKFNSCEGGFRDRDLYVFCYDMNSGKFTAHVNKALLGTDVKALKAAGYREQTPYDDHLRQVLGEQRWAKHAADPARVVCAALITDGAAAGRAQNQPEVRDRPLCRADDGVRQEQGRPAHQGRDYRQTPASLVRSSRRQQGRHRHPRGAGRVIHARIAAWASLLRASR